MIFNVNYELHAEDARPLNIMDAGAYILGSFDGMGGAGGMQYTMPDGIKRSGAYLASRQVREIVHSFAAKTSKRILQKPDKTAAALAEEIFTQLTAYADENNLRPNIKIRGTMIKLLPTTMAVIVCSEEKETVHAVCLWCGDSRCYVLSPETGLSQLTTDDLAMQNDAMENLLSDSPMSNNIYLPLNAASEPPFKINCRSYTFEKPCILFTATDGCFGYVESPMHFEKCILNAIHEGAANHSSIEEMGDILQDMIQKITSDDCTLSARVFMEGTTLDELSSLFAKRSAYLAELLANVSYKDFGADELLEKISALDVRQDNLTAFLESELKTYIISCMQKSLETGTRMEEIDRSLSSCGCINTFTGGYNLNGAVSPGEGMKAAESFYEKNSRMLLPYLMKNYTPEHDSQLAIMLSAYRENQAEYADLMRSKKEVERLMQEKFTEIWHSSYKKSYEQYLLTEGQ